MHEICFTTVTFRKKSRREICEIAFKNGIKSIEWGGDIHLPTYDKFALREVLELQKEYDLKAVSYGSYYRLGMNDFDLWREICGIAYETGAKIIRIWQGDISSPEVSEDEFKKMVAETRKLSKIADEFGLTVAFEFHKNTNNDTGASSLRFLKAVNCKNVKTYWQPFSLPGDEENLKAVLPHLAVVHVFNWNKKGKRFSLKRGSKRWRRFIDIIEKSDCEPYFILEFVKGDRENQFKRDVKTLKKWLSKAETEIKI